VERPGVEFATFCVASQRPNHYATRPLQLTATYAIYTCITGVRRLTCDHVPVLSGCHVYTPVQVFDAHGDQEVGKISKQWSGFVQEYFTDADNFGVNCTQSLQYYFLFCLNPR